jgi:hypothetical protein
VKEFDLPLANATGKPVKVLSVETSCTCMKVTVPEPLIAPGATGRVHCVFTVPNATGTIQKPVILKTDSAERPKELAMVRVDVPSELIAEPERLAWSVGEPAGEKTLRLKVADEGVLRVLGVKCSRDLFEWSLKTILDGREYELRVKPKNTVVPALGMFLLQTDSTVPRQKTRGIYAVVEAPKNGVRVESLGR